MILLLVCAFLLFAYACLIFYYYRGWNQLKEFRSQGTAVKTFISVIIPVRNEELHLKQLVDSLKQQDYPVEFYEVILVDDFSTDATPQILDQLSSGNLRWIRPDGVSQHSSKKKAIDTGIRTAKGNLVVTTDADCTHPANWLSVINEFHQKTGSLFIAAPVKFHDGKNLLSVFQALDFITLQGITGAGIAKRFHFMCNGANLAYKREAFFQVKGFEGIDHIASGDDMLLMYKIWKKYPDMVEFLKSKEAIVLTEPEASWKNFFKQRKRWAGKSLVYDDYRMILVLLFVYLLNVSFIVLIGFSIFHSFYWPFVLFFWVIKTLIEWPFVSNVARFYGELKLMKYFFWIQPIHMVYTASIGIISQWGRYEWKGRRTK